jgi:hypothetical protein
MVSNYLPAHLLPDEVYNQNNQQNGSNAYSENIHGIVLRPFICFGRELISFRSPTVTPPETAAVATPHIQIQKELKISSDNALTLGVDLSMLRANYGQWIRSSIKAVLLVS